MNKINVRIILILVGLVCYLYGFIWFSILNTIIMGIGGFLIFIPLLLIGLDIRTKKRLLSNVIVGFSIFFTLVIAITLIGTVVTYVK